MKIIKPSIIFILFLLSLFTVLAVMETGYFGDFIQNKFTTGNGDETIEFNSPEFINLTINLPKYINVTNAKINLSSEQVVSGYINISNFPCDPDTSLFNCSIMDQASGDTLHDPDSFVNPTFAFDENDGTAATKTSVGSADLELGKTFSETLVSAVNYKVRQTHDGGNSQAIYLQTYDGSTWTSIKTISIGTGTDVTTEGSHLIDDEIQGLRIFFDFTSANSNHQAYLYTLEYGETEVSYNYSLSNSSDNEYNYSDGMNSFLEDCEIDGDGYCNITLQIFQNQAGNLTLNLNQTINYSYQYDFIFDKNKIERTSTNYSLIVYSNETVSSKFYYNDIEYTPTKTQGLINSTFDVFNIGSEWVDNDSSVIQENFTSFWEITLFDNVTNTSNHTQTLNKIYLDNVDTCDEPTTLNFTIKNVSNNELVVGDLDIYFKVWNDNVLFFRNYTFSLSGDDSYSFCISPEDATYKVDSQMEYEAPGFSKKLYYLVESTISNVTESISLYLDDGTTQVNFQVTDFVDTPVAGAIVKVLKYDVGTDSYTTTEILETDTDGNAWGQIILNTEWYAFIVEVNGVVKLQTLPTKITSTTKKLRINLEADYLENYDKALGISSSLTFTNSTKNFAFTYTDTSNLAVTGCLKVVEISTNSETLIADNCTNSAAATLLVNIGASVDDKTYVGTGYIIDTDGSEYVLDTLEVSFNELFKKFGKEGLFISFFVILGIVLIALWSPPVAVVFGTVAVAFLVIMDLFHLSWGVLVALFVLAGITMYKLSK